MPITKIQLKPGLIRDTTSYMNEGGWYYSDKIRFRSGSPERIGGWQKFTNDTYLGTCTTLNPWVAMDGNAYTGVGTNLKFYIEKGGGLYDVTPLRKTTNPLPNNPITTYISSATIQITDTAHGASINDFVTISGITGPINNIPASDINKEHQITKIVDVDHYEVVVATAATANGTGGGAAGIAAYQIHVGLATYVAGVGFGAGPWGSGVWGGGVSPSVAGQLRIWEQDTFGEDLIFNDMNGEIYYWDATSGVGTRAVRLVDMGGASDVPVTAMCVHVTESRHVVALGCNPLGSGTMDPLMIRWSTQESAVDWTPTVTNTAGGYRLTHGNMIMCGRNTRQETLVFTDEALYSMQYVGAPYVFSIVPLANPISLIGPYAVAIVGGSAFWMGYNKFYVYNGTVNTLDCPLRRLLETNLNYEQAWQVFAGTNELYTEITWFYCSTNSTRVDSYITYNYVENLWYFGTLDRSAWHDAGLRQYPMAADNQNNVLVYHELGTDDASTGVPQAIHAYIESSDFDLGDGDQFMFIRRALPDVSFSGSTAASPSVTFTLKTRFAPGSDWNSNPQEPGQSVVTSTGFNGEFVSPIETYTPQFWVRLRGRQASMRIESNAVGVKWQLGALRLDIRPDGRR